ncbi:MAG: hypothetical protein ABGZ53_22545 [Fuerstiella sp.]
MNCKNRTTAGLILVICGLMPQSAVMADNTSRTSEPAFRGALLSTGNVTSDRLKSLGKRDYNAIVVVLTHSSAAQLAEQERAANLVTAAHFDLHYWIEIARCPELADAHPEWMASLQTHDEWRRFFPDTPRPNPEVVVKTYPWVPILAREPFDSQLKRVKGLLAELPRPVGVFLNDLQGAPSACGCGNSLCRWTSDYGRKRTTIPLGDDAANLFVDAVSKAAPGSKVIPVWTTECEKHDGRPNGLCAGVGCFEGICWKASVRQLAPLEQSLDNIAVLVPYKEFQRDLPIYGEQAGWIRHAVESFVKMPVLHGSQPIRASRLMTVLQGWNVDDDEIAQQIRVATQAGVCGYVVALNELNQSWKPKLVRWR